MALFFLSDFFEYGLEIQNLGIACILFMLMDMFMDTVSKKIRFTKQEQGLILLVVCILFISFIVWDSTYTIYSYVAIIPVFWVFKKIPINKLEVFFKIALMINLILAGYEYFTETYLYEAKSQAAHIELTYREISGNVKRAKGLFPGPLTLSNFAMAAALIFPRNKMILFLGLMISFLANARLSILVILIIYTVFNFRLNFKSLSLFLFFYLFINSIIDESGIDRLFSVFDVKSNNNEARLFYMSSAIELFLDYPLVNLIFGNSGKLLSLTGNNAESGWLTLLVENGLVGFALYFGFLIKLIFNKINLGILSKVPLIILFFVMNVQTFYLSLLGPLWFWLPIIYHKNFQNKIYKRTRDLTTN